MLAAVSEVYPRHHRSCRGQGARLRPAQTTAMCSCTISVVYERRAKMLRRDRGVYREVSFPGRLAKPRSSFGGHLSARHQVTLREPSQDHSKDLDTPLPRPMRVPSLHLRVLLHLPLGRLFVIRSFPRPTSFNVQRIPVRVALRIVR